MEHKSISVDLIKPDPEQPRKAFDNEELKALTKSIITHGLLQSIVVREVDKQYIIVAGERRYRACLMAGMKEISCHVLKKGQHKELALIENIQRVNLEPMEEAEAFRALMDLKDYSQEELANIIGKTRRYVGSKLKLLSIDPEVREELAGLQEGHGIAIASLKTKTLQKRLLKEIKEHNLSVKAAERRSRKLQEAHKAKKKIPELIADKFLESAIAELEEKLSTKISLSQKKKNGTLIIEYYGQEDLENLLEKLLKS